MTFRTIHTAAGLAAMASAKPGIDKQTPAMCLALCLSIGKQVDTTT